MRFWKAQHPKTRGMVSLEKYQHIALLNGDQTAASLRFTVSDPTEYAPDPPKMPLITIMFGLPEPADPVCIWLSRKTRRYDPTVRRWPQLLRGGLLRRWGLPRRCRRRRLLCGRGLLATSTEDGRERRGRRGADHESSRATSGFRPIGGPSIRHFEKRRPVSDLSRARSQLQLGLEAGCSCTLSWRVWTTRKPR